MKRIRPGGNAPIALILAFVFPAIIAAALALAYYGYQSADSVSRPLEEMFRASSRKEAAKTLTEFEARVDQPAHALFERLAAEKREPALPSMCEVDAGPAVEWYVVLTADKSLDCHWPASAAAWKRIKPEWEAHRRKLEWKAVKLESHHHYHEVGDKGSTLLVYTARKAPDDQPYFAVVKLRMELVGKKWLDEAMAKLATELDLKVAVLDADGRQVAGEALGEALSERDARFLYEDTFGKALYRWRLQVVPQNADALRADLERQKWLRPLLIIFSTGIIAIGLGIVWLVILAERRTTRLKGDFIANVSHELKTPLSLIRMFGEMVATGRHKGEHAAREYGAIITRESERLSHLIDNVLDFARLERGKASYDFAEGDVTDVLERALDICRYRLEKEKLKLRTAIEPRLPRVRMDENAMTLVVLNLVDNAIKYAAEGGHVDVSLQRSPGGVVVGVRDYGPGVEGDEQHRIFERFYRARGARDRNVRGSGIGLALVKYIAEAHGGRVTVESPVVGPRGSSGCLFQVFLPAPVSEGVESGAQLELPKGDTTAVDVVVKR